MKFVTDYLNDLQQAIAGVDPESIARAIDWLKATRDAEGIVYTCGNGGSSCIASQMVVDLVKCGSEGKDRKFRVISLTDSVSTMTAFANDISYEHAFDRQLESYARPGDLLIGISGSGNSPNVINAIRYANDHDMRTIGLTTQRAGQLKDLAQLPLLVPESHMGRLEDTFFAITHILMYAFIEDAVS